MSEREIHVESIIFSSGLTIAAIVHILAWIIVIKTSEYLQRVQDCVANMKAAGNLIQYSEVTSSVLQLAADRCKFDPDVNEFERELRMLMLKDPQLTYTSEVMMRVIKKPSQEAGPAEKTAQPISDDDKKDKNKKEPIPASKERFIQPKDKDKKAGTKDPNYQTLMGLDNKDIFGEDRNKKKFKAPAKVEKADAKDPQYETLNGLGNDLFNEEAGDKDKDKDKKDQKEKKKEFKAPTKVQKADAKDPQYETLADVKDDIFKQ